MTNQGRSICGLLLAGMGILLLAGCAAQGPAPTPIAYDIQPWEFAGREGHKLLTEHYEVLTTTNDARLLETFPELLERSYEQYHSWVSAREEAPARMRVYLFNTRGEWVAFTRRFTGEHADIYLKIHNGGYSLRGVSVIQYVSHPVTFPLLAHEGFHQYLDQCVNPNVPAWINEGLAVVSECQRWTGGGLQEFDPWYNPSRRNHLGEALLRERLMPLQRLLDTHAGEVVLETSDVVRTYYAQVWGLMLFLWYGENGKYAADFERLCDDLSKPGLDRRLRAEAMFTEGGELSRGAALFRAYIGEDISELDRQYQKFLRERILSAR